MTNTPQPVKIPTLAERLQRYCAAVPVIEERGCKQIVVGWVCEKRPFDPVQQEKKAA